MMYRYLSILLVIMGLALIACDDTKPVSVQDIQGNTIELINNQGKWLVINYWASWCKPCYEEIPQLNALYQAHKKQGDLLVVGVSFEQLPKPALQDSATKLLIQYPVLSTDPAKSLGIKEVANLPATFIVSPQGKLVDTLFGKQTQQSIEQAVEAVKKVAIKKG